MRGEMSLTSVIIAFLRKPSGKLCLSAGVSVFLALIVWLKKYRSKKLTVPELDDSGWIETGRVEELYFYPLKSGRGQKIGNAKCTDFGISVEQEGLVTLNDRMLLVYSGKTGTFKTARNFPSLLLVRTLPVDEERIKLQVDGMPDLVFRLPEVYGEQIECSMWWGELIKCIDCGSELAAWISEFLTGTVDSDLRIGAAIVAEHRNIFQGPWAKYTKVYRTLRNEDTGYFADLASYMLINEKSLGELNKRLERPVGSLQFRPNIVVSGCAKPFAEDNWQWIKIGSSVIMRNVKPCPRCTMIRIDPETGKVDKEEPLKTLRSFREQKDPQRLLVDGNSPTLGIYCGLYKAGIAKIGDPVFVHNVLLS